MGSAGMIVPSRVHMGYSMHTIPRSRSDGMVISGDQSTSSWWERVIVDTSDVKRLVLVRRMHQHSRCPMAWHSVAASAPVERVETPTISRESVNYNAGLGRN